MSWGLETKDDCLRGRDVEKVKNRCVRTSECLSYLVAAARC